MDLSGLPGLPSDFMADDFDLSWLTDGFTASPALPGASFGSLMPELALAAAAARASPAPPGPAPQPLGHAPAESSGHHCNAASPPSVQQHVPRPPSPSSCPTSHAPGQSHPAPECVQLHSQQSTASVECMTGEGGSLPTGQGQQQRRQLHAQHPALQLQQQPQAQRRVTQAGAAGSGASDAVNDQERLALLLRYQQLRRLLADRQRQQQQAVPSHQPAPMRDWQSLPLQGVAGPDDPAPPPAFGSERPERQRSRSVPPQLAAQPPEQPPQQPLTARNAQRSEAAPNELHANFAFEGGQQETQRYPSQQQQYLPQQQRYPPQQQQEGVALEGGRQEPWKDPTEELLERQARHQQRLLEAYRQRQRAQRGVKQAAAQRAQQQPHPPAPDRPSSRLGNSCGGPAAAAPRNPQHLAHGAACPAAAAAAPRTSIPLGSATAPLPSPFSSQWLSAPAGLGQAQQQQHAGGAGLGGPPPPQQQHVHQHQQQQQRAGQHSRRFASAGAAAYQPDQLQLGHEQQQQHATPLDHKYHSAPTGHTQHLASSFQEEMAEALAAHPSLPRSAHFAQQSQQPGLARGREPSPQLQEPRRAAPAAAAAAAPRLLSATARALLQQGTLQPLPAPPGVEEAGQLQGHRGGGGRGRAGRALQGSAAVGHWQGQQQQPAPDALAAGAAVLMEPASSESEEDRASHSPKVGTAHGGQQQAQQLSAQEQARLRRIESARRTRKRKAEYVSGLEQQNVMLRAEVQRLTRVLRSWATQGYITPQQALEFLHTTQNNSQALALLDAGSLNLSNARQAQQQ